MRDKLFLQKRLNFLVNKYFPDAFIKKENIHNIHIKWGRNALYRFGSIKYLFKKKVEKHLKGKKIKQVIYVPGKIINFVTAD